MQDKPGRLEKAGIKRATEQVETARENRVQAFGEVRRMEIGRDEE